MQDQEPFSETVLERLSPFSIDWAKTRKEAVRGLGGRTYDKYVIYAKGKEYASELPVLLAKSIYDDIRFVWLTAPEGRRQYLWATPLPKANESDYTKYVFSVSPLPKEGSNSTPK